MNDRRIEARPYTIDGAWTWDLPEDPMSGDRQIEATQYVLNGSWTCRRWRKHACSLVREAIEFLPEQAAASDQPADWRRRLAGHLKTRVREQRVGNPVIIYILLNVVIPIVVRLVIDWWLKRREATND